jgi:GT2 family glycosyltransferase
MRRPRLSIVIVAHDSVSDLRLSLPSLLAELEQEDELIVVDSGSSDGLAEELRTLAPRARLIEAPGNVGFAAGANRGAAVAMTDLIVVLNPDIALEHGWSDAIRAPWGGPWAGWMALVTMDGATVINTSGGVLHFTGLGWSGQVGEPISLAPSGPREVGFLSGACLAVPRATWDACGGFAEEFFMYCEDVDLSLRLRLRGGSLAVVPDAKVIHRYEFDKGPTKWRLLERNRWATVIRTFPASLLVLVAPALLATEFAMWVVALRGGWGRMKALATFDVARRLPRLAKERRAIQADRVVDAATFAASLTGELSSPYLGAIGRNRTVNGALVAYWGFVRQVLRLLGVVYRCRRRVNVRGAPRRASGMPRP